MKVITNQGKRYLRNRCIIKQENRWKFQGSFSFGKQIKCVERILIKLPDKEKKIQIPEDDEDAKRYVNTLQCFAVLIYKTIHCTYALALFRSTTKS